MARDERDGSGTEMEFMALVSLLGKYFGWATRQDLLPESSSAGVLQVRGGEVRTAGTEAFQATILNGK